MEDDFKVAEDDVMEVDNNAEACADNYAGEDEDSSSIASRRKREECIEQFGSEGQGST